MESEDKTLLLNLFSDLFGICKLSHNSPMPDWIGDNVFHSITRTADELSIVCPQKNIPENIVCERDWNCLKLEGPLDFSLIGILARISELLAEEKISIFVISTYDTDYILVKNDMIEKAVEKLTMNGYFIKQ